MGRKNKYINIFGSFTEPFNLYSAHMHHCHCCCSFTSLHLPGYYSPQSTSSLSSKCQSFMSSSTTSFHVFLCLIPSTSKVLHFFTQSSFFLQTWPLHDESKKNEAVATKLGTYDKLQAMWLIVVGPEPQKRRLQGI